MFAATCACVLAMAAPVSAEAMELGTNPDLTWGTSEGEAERTIAAMDDAGMQWARLAVSWKAVEPQIKGVYNESYLARVDTVVDDLHAAGIEVLIVFDTVPFWASADPQKQLINSSGETVWNHYFRPRRFGDYGDALRHVVNRFSRRGVSAYEVWNEPNHSHFWPSGPDPGEYAAMLQSAYTAVKSVDPSATVLGGSLSDNDYRFLEHLYDAGGGRHLDAVSTHTYPNAGPGECWRDSSGRRARYAFCSIEEIRDVMVSGGDAAKDIWITEFGWSTCSNSASGCWGKGVTEAKQAQYLVDALRQLESTPWVAAALQYNFRNTYWKRDDPGDFGGNLGLLRTDFSPKPAFHALRKYASAATAVLGPRRQKLGSNRRLRVNLGVRQAGRVRVRAAVIRRRGGKLLFPLGAKKRTVAAPGPLNIAWKLSPRKARKVRTALRRGVRLDARFGARLIDASGNRSPVAKGRSRLRR